MFLFSGFRPFVISYYRSLFCTSRYVLIDVIFCPIIWFSLYFLVQNLRIDLWLELLSIDPASMCDRLAAQHHPVRRNIAMPVSIDSELLCFDMLIMLLLPLLAVNPPLHMAEYLRRTVLFPASFNGILQHHMRYVHQFFLFSWKIMRIVWSAHKNINLPFCSYMTEFRVSPSVYFTFSVCASTQNWMFSSQQRVLKCRNLHPLRNVFLFWPA